jgi:hypothetical protein
MFTSWFEEGEESELLNEDAEPTCCRYHRSGGTDKACGGWTVGEENPYADYDQMAKDGELQEQCGARENIR